MNNVECTPLKVDTELHESTCITSVMQVRTPQHRKEELFYGNDCLTPNDIQQRLPFLHFYSMQCTFNSGGNFRRIVYPFAVAA